MFCKYCGTQLNDGMFCPKCGNPIDATTKSVAEKKSMSIASLVLGIVGVIAWLIPIIGFPVIIVGLILGIIGRGKGGKGMATAGITLCIITLVLTIANSAIGAFMGYNGQLWFQKTSTKEIPLDEKYTRTYTIKEDISESDLKDLVYILQVRADNFSTEAQVLTSKQNDGKFVIQIYIPEAQEEIFDEVTSDKKLEFIADYGTGDDEVIVTSANVKSAVAKTIKDTSTGIRYTVDISLDAEGTRLFAEGTQKYIGKQIFIIYGDEVLSAPVVQMAITDGNVAISNISTYNEAMQLATFISTGSLDYTLERIK